MRDIIMILIGIMFVLAGIFKWYIVLSIFTWRIKPDTKMDVWLIRIVSIIIGIFLVTFALYRLLL